MKLVVPLFIIVCFCKASGLSAQTVSLHQKNTPLEKVFREITKQTGFLFFYADGLIKKNDKVTVIVNNASLEQALNLCFANLLLTYTIVDKTIVIKEAAKASPILPTTDSSSLSSIIILGRVVNAAGEPLASATVAEKGTKNLAIANEDGSFRIAVKNSKSVLVISYVDKETIEAPATDTYLTITLRDADTRMDDVIIIGYETIRQKDLMASASAVNSKEIKDNPLHSLSAVLQGRLAGVQISTSEGAPGADATVNIRGRNSITGDGSPLYVVDGIPVENAFNTLNPGDIESIIVLKDAASTAIYGARGANGVIVITTKGGKNTNGKTVVTYNAYAGMQQLAKKLEMMDPYNFVLYQWDRALWRNDTTVVSRYTGNMSNFAIIENYYRNLQGFDWQEKTMGKNAFQQSHNITLSGGNNNTTYNLSLAGNNQQGVLINSDLQRRSVNFKFDQKAGKNFSFGVSIRYMHQQVNGAGTSDPGSGSFNRLRQYTRYRPVILPDQTEDYYDPNLDLNNNGNGFNIINPLLLSEAEVRRMYMNTLNLNGYVQFSLAKNLSFRCTLGYNENTVDSKAFDDTITILSKMYQKQPVVNVSSSTAKLLVNSNVLTYSNSSILKSRHALSVLLGQESQRNTTNSFAREIRWFPVGITADKAFDNLQLAAASSGGSLIQPNPISSQTPLRVASVFSTVDYNYDKKYLFKFTIRADGTSIFSPGNRWGYFPSGSFAWRISNEDFFRNINVITNLKLRISYGTSGNNRIDPFSYKTTFISPSNSGYGLNNILNGIYTPNNLGNEELRWERIISKNIGMDADLLNNRLSISLDAYFNNSRDLLLNNLIPTSSGYTSQFQNIGATRNKGIELQLSSMIVRKNNFAWSSGFNIAFNKNKITSLGNNQQILRSSGWFSLFNFPADYILQVGRETGLMYGLVNDGFFTVDDFDAQPYTNSFYPQYTYQYTLKPGIPNHSKVLSDPVQPGSPKFKDINGDGIIDLDNDRVVIGNAQPRFFGGLSQTFSYKNFDLSMFFNYSFGNDVYNANKLEYSNGYGSDINLLAIMNDRWKMIDANGKSIQAVILNTVVGADPKIITVANANAKIWFPSTSTVGFYPQKYAIEDGSYIRLNNLTVGYNMPKSLVNRFKINSLRLYVTANNLFILTKYSGFDPDVNTRRRDATTMGVDYSAYPRARTFVSGVNLSL